MGMALRSDVADACRAAGTEKPIDLAFLAMQTMGDATLEMDILCLFCSQTAEFSSAVRNARTPEDVKRVAHTLKGAARSIGAFRLAKIASDCEDRGNFDVDEVQQELDCICDYVGSLKSR